MLTNLNKDGQGNKIERTLGKTKASQSKRWADFQKTRTSQERVGLDF
jgi:hypothetical protein